LLPASWHTATQETKTWKVDYIRSTWFLLANGNVGPVGMCRRLQQSSTHDCPCIYGTLHIK